MNGNFYALSAKDGSTIWKVTADKLGGPIIGSPLVEADTIYVGTEVGKKEGNLIALDQKNIKSMLAYSSIAHAGYAMIGVVAYSLLGMASSVFYLLAYVLTNLLAFAIVTIVGKEMGSEETVFSSF